MTRRPPRGSGRTARTGSQRRSQGPPRPDNQRRSQGPPRPGSQRRSQGPPRPDSQRRSQGPPRPDGQRRSQGLPGRDRRPRSKGLAPRARRTSPRSTASVLASQRWDSLRPFLPAGAAPEEKIERLRRYCALVLDWNHEVSNLISRADEPRIVERHVLESIEPASWLSSLTAERWLDFGSGAGFPAIPLALVGVGRKWVLVETRRPKALFLRKAVIELGLKDFVSVHHGRLEQASGLVEPVNAMTARATYRIPPTLHAAGPLVLPGGSAVLWKGSEWKKEIGEQLWQNEWELAETRTIGSGLSVVVRFIRR